MRVQTTQEHQKSPEEQQQSPSSTSAFPARRGFLTSHALRIWLPHPTQKNAGKHDPSGGGRWPAKFGTLVRAPVGVAILTANDGTWEFSRLSRRQIGRDRQNVKAWRVFLSNGGQGRAIQEISGGWVFGVSLGWGIFPFVHVVHCWPWGFRFLDLCVVFPCCSHRGSLSCWEFSSEASLNTRHARAAPILVAL